VIQAFHGSLYLFQAPAVLGFGVGAIAGAAAWHVATFWALLLPTALLAVLALRGR